MPFYDRGCPACAWTQDDCFEPVAHTEMCPSCGAATERIWKARTTNSKALVDEWPTGKTFENGFPEPRTFYSRSEYRKALAERGFKVRGDGEESCTWISRETLAKAKELVSRC